VVIGYPLDTVKVKIQSQDPSSSTKYRGTFHCLSDIFKQDGAKGLFRGMSSPLAGVAAINAITFGVYGNALRCMEDQESVKSVTMAGMTAGIVQTFIVSPMELVKTQMQVCGETSISSTCRMIYQSAGMSGFTRGLALTFTREVPAIGVFFGSYEIMIREFGESTATILGAGGIAGVLSWVLTYPQDVLKTRLQADGFGARQTYSSSSNCMKLSLEKEGSKFLTRGLSSTVIRAFPVNAATFFVYSAIMKVGDMDTKADEVYDTLKTLCNTDKYMAHSAPVDSSWSKKKHQRLATITTDMPNIIHIQEQSSISQWRLYPEQMLYACPSVEREPRHTDSTSSAFRENFNQFNQCILEETSIPTVLPVYKPEHDESQEIDRPSLLGGEVASSSRWRTCIRTSDFLLPSNLLPSNHRIYGFYYLVA